MLKSVHPLAVLMSVLNTHYTPSYSPIMMDLRLIGCRPASAIFAFWSYIAEA